MTTMTVQLPFSENTPAFKLDIFSFCLALALHVPLYFVKFDANKKAVDVHSTRLVSVDLIDQEDLNKPAPPPPPPLAAKESNLMSKLKMLVRKEPPPPPPPPKAEKVPDKLDTGPKEIKLQPNLKMPEPVQSKLAGKSGFKTTADPKLVEEKQISLKTMGTGLAPLSEKKLGTVTDRGSLKSDKGNFKIAQTDNLKSIGGSAPGGLADPSAPTIAIRTGGKGSSEQFSAPAPQKMDKGKLGAVGTSGLGGDTKLGLRDQMIARDAPVGQIAVRARGGVAGGVEGGVEGGVVGGKKDAGRSFQGGQVGGVAGGVAGGTVGSVASGNVRTAAPTSRSTQKKSMFTITGPLKDRQIQQQVIPEYPAWAQAQGVEASVVLEFTVEPNGSVKDSIVVRRTTGYPQLDQAAMKALRKWKFAPLPAGSNEEQVGTITFNFSLS